MINFLTSKCKFFLSLPKLKKINSIKTWALNATGKKYAGHTFLTIMF